jgi:hypothetical protein
MLLTAGSVARVTCTRNHARSEPVEAEIPRQRLAELGLQISDSVTPVQLKPTDF